MVFKRDGAIGRDFCLKCLNICTYIGVTRATKIQYYIVYGIIILKKLKTYFFFRNGRRRHRNMIDLMEKM